MRALLVSLILIQLSAHADMDEHEQQGLKDTKQLLTNPKERAEIIKGDKTATEVDKKVEALTGSGNNKEELYGIASEVMEKIAVESKGDSQKMQQLLMEAQANPQKFYDKYFSAAQKTRVKNLASEIEKKQSPSAGPKN